MPKRTTLTFTSEDAPQQPGAAEQLYVYYCKYTGKHAFTIGACKGWESACLVKQNWQANEQLCPTLFQSCTSHSDTDINKLPRRRTDGARIVDTQEHSVMLYTTPGGSKLIKRCGVAFCFIVTYMLTLINACSLAGWFALHASAVCIEKIMQQTRKAHTCSTCPNTRRFGA